MLDLIDYKKLAEALLSALSAYDIEAQVPGLAAPIVIKVHPAGAGAPVTKEGQ